MTELENIREWEGKNVVDPDGAEVGRLEDVYFDAETDQPLFVTVHTGLFGRHLTFVPTEGATLGQDYLKVARLRSEIHHAPNIEKGGDLSLDEEARVYKYYGMAFQPASTEAGRRLVRH
ncbi:MAG: PRC-barrel domain-containing protein [Candidatus Dormiibacterota bacterium]